MGNFDGKFNSAKQEWETPRDLFDKLNIEFNFTIDLAANEDNTRVSTFFSKEDDSMIQEWKGVGWLNPPYGATGKYKLSNWVKKAYEETNKNKSIVVIIMPARTNTNWWHDYCMKSKEIKFIKGRPKFGGAKYGLPQPLSIVVFDGNNTTGLTISTFSLPDTPEGA